MRKNDVFKWTAKIKIVAIDVRKDKNDKEYCILKTERGSRVLTWDKTLWTTIEETLQTPPFPTWESTGYINQILGNSFLVLIEAIDRDKRILEENIFDICEWE